MIISSTVMPIRNAWQYDSVVVVAAKMKINVYERNQDRVLWGGLHHFHFLLLAIENKKVRTMQAIYMLRFTARCAEHLN